MLRNTVIWLSLAFLPLAAYAQETPSPAPETTESYSEFPLEPNIKRGDWEVGGSANWSSYGTNSYEVSIRPSASYFVRERLSLGAEVSVAFSNSFKSYGVGPRGAYYFWNRGMDAAYVALKWRHSFSRSQYANNPVYRYTSNTVSPGLGYKKFLLPSVAIGALFEINRVIFDGEDDHSMDLSIQFAIHL